MKKVFFLLFFVYQYNYSQQKGIVYYGYVESLTEENEKGRDSNAYIVFNKEQSYYVTAKDSLEAAERKNAQKITADEDNNKAHIYFGLKVSPSGDQVVYNIKKKTMWSNILFRKHFYIKEIVPDINWKISNETKKIGNFNCTKASTLFRGRYYTAWYTKDIPLPFGPWKLNGLPGLILEAYDNKKSVSWYFKSAEYPTTNKENVKYLSIPKKDTFKSFEEFKLFQIKQQSITIDKQKVVQKKFPDVIFIDPKISEMFIEF